MEGALHMNDNMKKRENQEDAFPIEALEEKKMENTKLADAAELAGYEAEARRLRSCGLFPVVAVNKLTGKTGVISLFHCCVRLCPVCEWRRSRTNFYKLSEAFQWIKEREPGLVPVFLTLTVKNTDADGLRFAISHTLQSFSRLLRQRPIQEVVRGYYRGVEVTRNRRTGQYHPHIHVLMLMPETYAQKGGPYISHTEWVRRWKMALDIDYSPSVRIERVGQTGNELAEHKAVLEVVKYSVKGSDMLTGTKRTQARVWSELYPALRQVRLMGTGGIIREALRALKLDKLDELESPEDMSVARQVEASPADWVLLYWRWGGSGYVLDIRKDGAEGC